MNSLWNIAWWLSEWLQKARVKLNQVSEILKKVPDILTFSFSWKKSANLPKISSINFKLYIWQIFEDWRWLYDEEFIIWAIKTYLERLNDWEELVIESASIVSWLINWLREEDSALTTDKQIKYLEEIIEKYFHKEKNKIKISKVEDTHIGLFKAIEENWLDWLKWWDNVKLTKDFSSLDIAKVLFQAAQENENFFNKLVSTIWEKKQKTVKHDKNDLKSYYALIEIAFRLTDFIKWISIHWWESRQREYDQIIIEILSWWFDHDTKLKAIKEFVLSNAKIPFFRTLNFNKAKYKKEKERQIKEKEFNIKSRIVTIPVALFVAWLIWWQIKSTWDNYEKEEEVKLETIRLKHEWNQALTEALKALKWDTSFRDTTDNRMWTTDEYKYNTPNKQANKIEELANRTALVFISRYWKWNNVNQNFIYWLLAQTMKDSIDYFKIHSSFSYWNWSPDFIRNVFIPTNRPILKAMWFQINTQLWIFEKYRNEVEDTAKISFDDSKKIYIKQFLVTPIWEFINGIWIPYKLWVIECWEIYHQIGNHVCNINDPPKKIIVAKYWGDESWSAYYWILASKELLWIN